MNLKALSIQQLAAHLDHIKRLSLKPEDLMPWKLHGDKWHLGREGIPNW